MKAQKKASSDGGPIANMGPPPTTTPGFEKSVSFQKSILGPRPKHIIVNNVKVPVASDNEVKQFYKPLSKPEVGFLKPNFRSKTPPPRRVINNYPRPKTPQPKRNIGRQNQPRGLPICLGVDLEPDEWIKDSECSKHIAGNRKLFSSYKAYNGGQICDNKCRVTFSEHDSEITKDGKVIGRGIRKKDLYVMKLGNKPKDQICLATIDENSTLWHRRLGHANMRLIQLLASKELVRNLPKLKFDQHFCDACKIGKQAHASHKAKNIVSTTRCLEILHMDLFGPSAVRSYGGNRYTLVILDDYSRYTWTRFLKDKTEAFDQFEIFIPRTPQSNGVVERKNRTLQEMSRTMLNEQSLPQKFWCNAVDTSTYILKQILIRAILGKTPYELLKGRKPTLDYFRVFGSKCFILNTKDYLTKFDPKSYEGILLGYSQNSKAYIILNKHTGKVKESLNVTFDETPPPSKTSPLVDDDLDEEEAIKVTKKKNLENDIEDETLEIDEINVNGALGDESWIVAMQEELNQFVANDVWELVPQPRNMTIIGTKWVFRNKLDENGIVSRNKARLVAQGYNQQEGIDYDETYALVARLESIRILLAYACALDFKLFQMDVKSAFLNGFINEELAYGVPADGPYQTNPPSPDDIISSIRIDQEGQVRRIRHEEEIDVHEYQILIREIVPTLKPLEEIIWENIFYMGGNQDHVPACLCYMLYCVVHFKKFTLAYYMAKRMECVTKQKRLILPYGMLLTRLFKFIMNENHELYKESYILYDHVMNPLAAQQERKTRKDRGTRRGRHSTSSSSAFDQPSSSHLNDDDDGNGEKTSRASTPSPIRYVNSLTN
ncbi:retrovirus-related pol polyprotein from transposon TNT 1-94 [Tanacetum coccineum]